ncbi:GNAT family N-acetyltransferase [Desulfovibrio inopinatus]|uniref:GNAT family N-acetyltransferase n=1 Tax=Desulfovibrio inopinatus TaxID=102109 RepID=UPI00047F01E1|nr:GNAT family N-acetyltransferase [Desulfovibrio inopinatus]
MNVLLLTGAPRSSRIHDFLSSQCDSLDVSSDVLVLDDLIKKNIDYMVCHGYPHILRPEVTQAFHRRIINLHNTYLPWGRGMMGNVWSYFEDAPKGVSLHFIDAGVDSGEIIHRRSIPLGLDETLQSSWNILMDALEELFIAQWPTIVSGQFLPVSQSSLRELGSYHDRSMSKAFMELLPEKWKTPVSTVADLGRAFRKNPKAFEEKYGVTLYAQKENAPLSPAFMRSVDFDPQGEITVREATADDLLQNWLWVNDPLTRKMFKQNEYIGWSEHCDWYERMLNNEEVVLCIGMLGEHRIGNVRFDRRMDRSYEMSINLDPSFRYKGFGSQMLTKAISLVRQSRDVELLFAMAKKVNVASIRVFEKSGVPAVERQDKHPGMTRFEPEIEVYMEKTFS